MLTPFDPELAHGGIAHDSVGSVGQEASTDRDPVAVIPLTSHQAGQEGHIHPVPELTVTCHLVEKSRLK